MSQIAFIVDSRLNQNRLFDIKQARDNSLERFVRLKQLLEYNGISCNTLDMSTVHPIDILVCTDISGSLKAVIKSVKQNPSAKLLYIPTEPPIISALHDEAILSEMPFDRVLFWDDEFVAGCRHGVKCNIGQPVIEHSEIPIIPFQNKRFMVAVFSNKFVKHVNSLYPERLQAVDFFSSKAEGMDLYGMGWGTSTRPSIQKSYQGKCETKKDVLKHYKFSICFENARGYKGLITEKIFDCFAAGNVPVYLGPPNIEDYIPKSCFVDFRDFNGYQSLYKYLTAMTSAQYQAYLDAAREYLQSLEYGEFTSDRYAEIILEQVQSLLKAPPPRRTVFGFRCSLFKLLVGHPLFFIRNFKGCRRFLFDLVSEW